MNTRGRRLRTTSRWALLVTTATVAALTSSMVVAVSVPAAAATTPIGCTAVTLGGGAGLPGDACTGTDNGDGTVTLQWTLARHLTLSPGDVPYLEWFDNGVLASTGSCTTARSGGTAAAPSWTNAPASLTCSTTFSTAEVSDVEELSIGIDEDVRPPNEFGPSPANIVHGYVLASSEAPVAAFTTARAPNTLEGTYGFDGSTSAAAAGRTIKTYRWTFGDGTPAVTTTVPTTKHRYRKDGTYTQTLIVTDSTDAVSAPSTRKTRVVLKRVRLSGTVRTVDCGDRSCRAAPARGVKLTLKQEGKVTATATSTRTGTWAATVVADPTTVVPKGAGFAPVSRTVPAKVATAGLDFAACGAVPAVASRSVRERSARASLSTLAKAPSCPDGLEWEMLGRTSTVPTLATRTANGMIRKDDIYAPLTVRLFLTIGSNRVETCAPSSRWTWTVAAKPAGAKVLTAPAPGCRSVMQVDTQGAYTLVAKRFVPGTAAPRQTIKKTVKVHDLLVLGMGDSNGSGEGIGPFWFDQCNRGSASYQYQAAGLLEAQSRRRSSVTFVSASCSGARTQHLGAPGYAGVNPGQPMAAQIKQLATVLAPPRGTKARTPDAALISIGINDIGFGAIIGFCVEYHAAKAASDLARASMEPPLPPDPLPWDSCQDAPISAVSDGKGGVAAFRLEPQSTKTLAASVTALLGELPARYEVVDGALRASGLIAPSKVYLSQYPTFSYGDGDEVCDASPIIVNGFPTLRSPLPSSVWQWFTGVGRDLNNAVKAGAAAQHWKVVAVPEGLFFGHGYCARDRWFVAILDQLPPGLSSTTYNVSGLFHPTARGARVTGVLALKQMCPLLASAAACTNQPKP